MSIGDEIKNLIKGEVSSDEAELLAFSQDASIFNVRPSLVIKPKDTLDLKMLVSYVAQKKSTNPELSLTARSAGSDMSGGPLNNSIILDFTAHFNKILGVGNSWAEVEPGVYYRDFEKETLKKNLLLPSYPASRELCTVGGMVANNSGGEKSLMYGKTENYIEELSVVLSDGNEYVLKPLNKSELGSKIAQNDFEGRLYKKIYDLIENNREIIQKAKPDVSKNSAGYYLWNVSNGDKFDLTKLFVGSQGTLGLVSKIKFRLVKPKKYSKLLVVFLKDFKSLGQLINKLLEHKPESLESYDKHTLELAIRFFPDMIKRMGGNAIGLMFSFLPEFWMVLSGGMPELVMIAEFTGDDEAELKERVKKAQESISVGFKVKTRITKDDAEAKKYWTIRRESFSLLRKHVRGKKTAPFIDDLIVKPEHLPEFLPKLDEILAVYKNITYTIAGHPGDGNFHIIPLMNLADPEMRKLIPEISDKVYNLVLEYKGSITAEHNDGLIRTPYLEKMYGTEIYNLFKEVKNIFDPLNIFNPGKKVGGSMEYSADHIKIN